MKKYIFLFAATILCACSHHASVPSYYTFATSDGGVAISPKKMSVDVARVAIPEYIDRAQIVTTDGVSVILSEDARWAERIGPMTSRRIMSGIRTRLTGASVKSSELVSTPSDYSVFVEIYRLDGAMPGTVVLDATYSIASGGDALRTRRVEYSADSTDSYSDYVSVIGALIDKLSRDISRDLDSLAK